MKAKRRHDLQENALSAELVDIIDFFKKRGSTILFVALIVVVVAVGGYYMYSSSVEKAAELQRRLNRALTDSGMDTATRERELKDLSGEEDQRIAAVASVALGDYYSRNLLFTDTAADPDRWRQLVDSAGVAYKSVIDSGQSSPGSVAMARMGLGKLAESLGKLGDARSQYEAVTNMADVEGHPAYNRAVAALETLDALGEPVRMAASAPAIDIEQPATQPIDAPADVEAPAAETPELPVVVPSEMAPVE